MFFKDKPTGSKAGFSIAPQRSGLSLRRSGNISFVYLIACMLCSLITAFLLNVGNVTHQKLQMQNAADSAAITASTWMTRGMNAITATNHVMGEMAGMVIVHHAIGGYPLDGGRVDDNNPPAMIWGHDGEGEDGQPRNLAEMRDEADRRLDRAYQAANGAGARTPAYETVRQKEGIRASLTLLESKIVLKNELTRAYWAKAAAKAMQATGIAPIVAAGRALEAAMDAYELVILKEYLFLKAMHGVAASLRPYKFLLRDVMLPAARDYTDFVVDRFPRLAERAAGKIGQELDVNISLFPLVLEMPLEKDPHRYARQRVHREKVPPLQSPPSNPTYPANNMREQVVKTSQLTRASFPWVNYHRQPILRLFSRMALISGAEEKYKRWTEGSSKTLLDEFQRPGKWDLGLYVLKGSTPPDRGYELWTKDRHLLDELFSIQAIAYREAPKMVGTDLFFRQAHPEGRIATAQSLIYNGNRQRPHRFHIPLEYKRIIPERQANVGWDTLNWDEASRPYELVAKTRQGGLQHLYPAIKVNWQTKLVPVSHRRLRAAFRELPDPIRSIGNRVNTKHFELQTH